MKNITTEKSKFQRVWYYLGVNPQCYKKKKSQIGRHVTEISPAWTFISSFVTVTSNFVSNIYIIIYLLIPFWATQRSMKHLIVQGRCTTLYIYLWILDLCHTLPKPETSQFSGQKGQSTKERSTILTAALLPVALVNANVVLAGRTMYSFKDYYCICMFC